MSSYPRWYPRCWPTFAVILLCTAFVIAMDGERAHGDGDWCRRARAWSQHMSPEGPWWSPLHRLSGVVEAVLADEGSATKELEALRDFANIVAGSGHADRFLALVGELRRANHAHTDTDRQRLNDAARFHDQLRALAAHSRKLPELPRSARRLVLSEWRSFAEAAPAQLAAIESWAPAWVASHLCPVAPTEEL